MEKKKLDCNICIRSDECITQGTICEKFDYKGVIAMIQYIRPPEWEFSEGHLEPVLLEVFQGAALTRNELLSIIKARQKFKAHAGKRTRLSKRNYVKFFARKIHAINDNSINASKKQEEKNVLFDIVKTMYQNSRFSRATFFRLKSLFAEGK